MNVQLLIDGLVRQTMVLLAHVATAAGARAQLASVANHVFVDLTQALQEQGVPRKVAADMFGMALRSYQQKIQRLTGCASEPETTLWEALHRYIADEGAVSRLEIGRRFLHDDPASVAGILRDMVDSGLVYRAGRGDAAVYRIAPTEEIERGLAADPNRTLDALVWVAVYQNGPIDRSRLAELVRADSDELDHALRNLLRDGRIREVEGDDAPTYASDQVLLPLGDSGAWGAALLDHHQVVVASMCAKLRGGQQRTDLADQHGGSTFSFDIWPGHPCEERARGLLSRTRRELQSLWDDVTEHNARGKPKQVSRVTFYCGQMVSEAGEEPDDETPVVEHGGRQ